MTFKLFEIEHSNKIYKIKITKRKNCKQIILKFNYKYKQPTLSIPYSVTYKNGLEFLLKNFNWIEKQAQYYVNSLDKSSFINIYDKTYFVKKIPSSYNKTQIISESNQIICYYQDATMIQEQLLKAFKKHAKIHLTELSKAKASHLGVSLNKISIRDTVSRWGSCSSMGNLNYSFRIIMAPYFVTDYIVAHEVAHLKEFNHSKKFWQVVDDLTPNRLAAENWLKTHRHTLY